MAREVSEIFQFVDQTQFNSLYPPLTISSRTTSFLFRPVAYYSFLKVIPRECKIRARGVTVRGWRTTKKDRRGKSQDGGGGPGGGGVEKSSRGDPRRKFRVTRKIRQGRWMLPLETAVERGCEEGEGGGSSATKGREKTWGEGEVARLLATDLKTIRLAATREF